MFKIQDRLLAAIIVFNPKSATRVQLLKSVTTIQNPKSATNVQNGKSATSVQKS